MRPVPSAESQMHHQCMLPSSFCTSHKYVRRHTTAVEANVTQGQYCWLNAVAASGSFAKPASILWPLPMSDVPGRLIKKLQVF